MCEKKFPFLELRSVFKDNDVHHVQSLEKRLEDLDSLSLNFWLTKFVLEVANQTKLISKHVFGYPNACVWISNDTYLDLFFTEYQGAFM